MPHGESPASSPPVHEWCSRADCTTPSCPYRPRKGSTRPVQDLSADCDYFSVSEDGRYGRPLSRTIMSHYKPSKEGTK